MITIQEFASRLTGREYTCEITAAECQLAKQLGFVVVFGASDDLMELSGAIYDEVGIYAGGRIQVDPEGILPDFDEIRVEPEETWSAWHARKERYRGGVTLEALWCKESGYSWTYRTTIPHATFEVLEDGEPYCRGIVFRLEDAVPTEGE